jgi:hypothetical protein
MSNRCPLQAEVTERLDDREIKVLLPCALPHGHTGPCSPNTPKEPKP